MKFSFSTPQFKREREYFTENLAMMLTSGLSIAGALDAIGSEIHSKRLKASIAVLNAEVAGGSFLWKALEKCNLFPLKSIALIRSGEETGKLAENLKLVADQQVKDSLLRSKLISALSYPSLVFSMTLVIGIGVALFVLPRLSAVFVDLEIPLPPLTKIIVNFGFWLANYGAIAAPALFLFLGTCIYILFFTKLCRPAGEAILFHMPGIAPLLKNIELARFGYMLGTMLEADIALPASLRSIAESTPFVRYRNLYAYLASSVEEGMTFAKGFASYPKAQGLISGPVRQLISISEQSGTLTKTVYRISQSAQEKTDSGTKNLASILEPIILLIVGGLVLLIVLGTILPIYGLIAKV